MSALSPFSGLTQEGRSRSRRGCWGGGGWSANHPEPRQAAHSQIRPPPPAHALPFKAAGLHRFRTVQRTLRPDATLPRRLTLWSGVGSPAAATEPPQPLRKRLQPSRKGPAWDCRLFLGGGPWHGGWLRPGTGHSWSTFSSAPGTCSLSLDR